ncbi:MAG: hypothetical protein ACK6D2_14110 [Planctomycetota bacterium]
MTRYDPFSYGQLPMGGKEPAPSSPDDILFDPQASPEPMAKSAMARGKPQANPWEAAAGDGFPDLLTPGAGQSPSEADATAMAFGAEVLGEVPADMAEPAPMPAPMPRPKPKAAAEPARAKAVAQEAAKAKLAAPRRTLAPWPTPLRRRSAFASMVGTLAVTGGGLAAAGWLLIDQHNPVLAAISAAASLVAGAITWLLLRR